MNENIKNKIIKNMEELYPDFKYELVNIIDRSTKFKVVCPRHGNIETSLAYIRKNKTHICKKCSCNITNSVIVNNNSTNRINELKNKFPDLDFSKFNYINRTNKSTVICKIHGEFESSYSLLIDKRCKYGCPYCSGNRVKDPLKDLKEKYPNFDFSKFNYINISTPSIVICPEHGEFKASKQRLMHKDVKYCCPKCRSINLKILFTHDYLKVISDMKKLHPEFDYSKFKYVDSRTPSIIICPTHGEFTSNYDNFMRQRAKKGCPKCSMAGYSKSEKEIVEFIKTFYDKKIIENNRNIILNEYSNNYLELDIYLPDIKLAIEFNGRYWHNDESISKRVGFNTAEEYHSYKSNKCKEQNIFLLHIDEQEWLDNKNNVLNNIKDKIISIL